MIEEWFWEMFEPTPTWPEFTFGQLARCIGANNDQICLPRGEMNAFLRYDFVEAIRVILAMFEPTPTWPNFYLGQLFIWIEANKDQICLPRGEMSDFEQCSNRLQLDLILLLVNFWYELGKIMTRYVFLEQLTYFYFWSTYDFRQVMTRYDC